MGDTKSELRRQAREIVDVSLDLLARDLRKFRRKFAPNAFLEEGGMVRTVPGGSYLITEETARINYATGTAHSAEDLTPGRLWKFQNLRWGYGELTLTVSAGWQAELTLTMGADQVRLRRNSKTYPADRVGWQHMLSGLRTGAPFGG
jgi:hypothetical protein